MSHTNRFLLVMFFLQLLPTHVYAMNPESGPLLGASDNAGWVRNQLKKLQLHNIRKQRCACLAFTLLVSVSIISSLSNIFYTVGAAERSFNGTLSQAPNELNCVNSYNTSQNGNCVNLLWCCWEKIQQTPYCEHVETLCTPAIEWGWSFITFLTLATWPPFFCWVNSLRNAA